MISNLMNYAYKAKEFIQSNKKICYIALAVVIVIITIIIVASTFKGTQYGNSVGNANNHGIVAEDSKWTYYIGIDDDEPAGIFKTKNSGKNSEKVIEGSFFGLNIIDNYIYCIEYDDSNYQANLVKIKTNGKDKETLAKGIDEDTAVIAVDKWIYYTKNSNLYRISTKGADREKISSKNIAYYQIVGKWIYYIYETDNAEYIAKMKLNGEDTQKLLKAEDEEFKTLYVKNNQIYYTAYEMNDTYDDEYNLYSIKTNGKNAKKICKIDNNIEFINMQEDGIYYSYNVDYDESEIKYIKYNGTGKTTIKKVEDIEELNIANDYIFILTEDEDGELAIKMISKDGKKEKIL